MSCAPGAPGCDLAGCHHRSSRAVSQGPQGPAVFVIREDNIAESRPIRLGHQLAEGWVVDFSSVLSIIIVIAGLAAMRALPIAQYPQILPPQVVVSATYPGASAETIAETVAAPLEQQVNGVEDMIYMQSTSTGSGTMTLSVYFQTGTDPDQATINVNNRVQRAISTIPQEVRRQGTTVNKRSTSILEVLTLSSPDGRYDTIYISNYALLNVIDELRRTPGVGDAFLFGASDYSMRIWLRPDKVRLIRSCSPPERACRASYSGSSSCS